MLDGKLFGMDEVLNQFENTRIGQGRVDLQQTNFDGLYKNWGRLGNQEERRRELLEVQKCNRNNNLDTNRGIFELVNAIEKSELFRTRTAYYRPSIYVAGFNKVQSYNDVLMLSEWIVEKPQDFETNWLVLPCPKGTRMLVVANNGITKFYSKYGQFSFECITALPGGNRYNPKKKQCCVLDGFYVKNNNTFYILDLLAWNNQPMTDGEADFRHYWLVSELDDKAALKVCNKKNEVIFSIIPKRNCDKENLEKFMMKYPHFKDNVQLDGLLFYHRQAHYVGGETPLAGWLYPFMVPEIIDPDIKINPAYMLEKPLDYICQADFIQKFEEKQLKKKKAKFGGKRRSRIDSAMDTADVKNEKNKEDAKPEGEMEVTELKNEEKKVGNDTVLKLELQSVTKENTKSPTSQDNGSMEVAETAREEMK